MGKTAKRAPAGKRKPATVACGAWLSPVTGATVAGQSLRFGGTASRFGTAYWLEARPAEKGRGVIVEWAGGVATDRISCASNARSTVHEYGGGDFAALAAGVFFIEAADHDIYRAGADEAVRITDQPHTRFADPGEDSLRARLVAVAEAHGDEGGPPKNFIAAIGMESGAVSELVTGSDFYAYPRFSIDCSQLAWIEWDLPNMPWEEARLCVGDIGRDGQVGAVRVVAGGDGTSVFQPRWSQAPDGKQLLTFIWDRSGWGNLHEYDGSAVRCLHEREAEFARPLWGLAASSYARLDDGRIAAAAIAGGESLLLVIDPETGAAQEVATGFRQIDAVAAHGSGIMAIAASDAAPPAVAAIALGKEGRKDREGGKRPGVTVLRPGAPAQGLEGMVSTGRLVTIDGDGGHDVHAIYYPPQNRNFTAPEGELPPAILSAHGGPTGMADRGLKLKIQYWTSRGFAFLDVDYRGSYGYGRAYREALDGNWGVADVADMASAARWLAAEGLADEKRLLISGGSAGGYTVLAALVATDVFAAGASHYGISDLARLAALTHKFESGYIYRLLGITHDNGEAVYKARSPLFHAGEITAPVIFFQGSDDKVVPPDQSRAMVENLKQRGLPVAYLEFAGEGHGFRQAANIKSAIEGEYAFYARILGIEPMEQLPALDIFNLD